MPDGEEPRSQSNAESQPFDASLVPADYVTLTQPRLLAAASQLRGGLYGYRNPWRLGRQRRSLAALYGLQAPADDDDSEEPPLREQWEP
jgi:hypothetical protein